MNSPQKVVEDLAKNSLFKDWQKQHPQAFLSHFFSPLDATLSTQEFWEVGYYDQKNNKITVFVELGEEGFKIKPEDDVFKKETEQVEELNLSEVKLSLEEAREVFKQNRDQYFPGEELSNGFIVLQTLEKKPLWNFTQITKSIKFANLKINALNGEIVSHQMIELMQK